MSNTQETTGNEYVRLIRVFVSSPSDVADERGVLEEVVRRINRTDGQRNRVRLEIFKWEQDVVPQVGPHAQDVVDAQTPGDYDIYLGIMAHRFGTETEGYGSGTEKEFRDALAKWGQTGKPWILFYFSDAPLRPSEMDFRQMQQYRRGRAASQGRPPPASQSRVRAAHYADASGR